MPTKIILDCDPGHDDAVAMLLAAGNPEIELLGITTVGGNHTLDKVTHNAQVVATIAGIDAPIYPGVTRPLVRPVEVAEDIHGDTGMEIHNYRLPEPTVQVQDTHAVDFIIDTVMSHEPGTVALVPTGPLTNIALAVRKEPRIAQRVKEVVLMGGGYHVGNWTAVAEFNIKIDPEAAHIVFNESWPLTMVGLDLLGEPEDVPYTIHVGTAQLLQRCVQTDVGSAVDDDAHIACKTSTDAFGKAHVLLGHIAGHRLYPRPNSCYQVRAVPPRTAQAVACRCLILGSYQHRYMMIGMMQ